MSVQPLIEQWFPAAKVGAESLRERGSAKAYPPINFLHVWWARRPLIASRAAVVASLLPAWPTDEAAADGPDAARVRDGLIKHFPDGPHEYHEWFLKTLGILGDPVNARREIAAAQAVGTTTLGNAYGYDRAFTVNPDENQLGLFFELAALRAEIDDPPVVLDPFAGGGSIPFEASRFGCRSIANELNPVAGAILEGTVVLPAQLGPEFAEVIKRYGTLWAERIEQRLAPYFPHVDPDERLAYIWAHTVPCPTTGRPTPLAPDYWLARGKAGRDVAVAVEADVESAAVHLKIVEGKIAKEWGDRSTYRRAVGTSIWSGETFDGDYIRAAAQSGSMGEMLLAVSVTRPGVRGRQFRVPSDEDLRAVKAACDEADRRMPQWEVAGLLPTEAIPEGADTRPQKHGMTQWYQLFTKRELLAMLTALEELHRVVGDAETELEPDATRALALYLAFAFDKSADYNSRMSSWDATRLKVRNTFEKHDFSFKWSFAEFDGASALFGWAAHNAFLNHRKISALVSTAGSLLSPGRSAQAEVLLGSATRLDLADASVDAVVTDPPYYDNVMYAELADYFYVWLKRSLRETWPQYCEQVTSDRQAEAVANPSLYRDVATYDGRGHREPGTKTASELANEHYEDLLTQAFREAHRVLRADGVLTVMFTHKRVDAWDTLGQALLEAGFAINSSWPVHTESENALNQARKNAASSTILLTCAKRGSTSAAYWADIKEEVARVARDSAARFADDGLVGIDLTLATFGPVLGVLSRNWPVYSGELGAEGKPQVLRPDLALDLAREEVSRLKKRGLLGGRDVEFDRVTDWYLLAWNDFQAAEFPYDEGRKLSIATHLELDDLAREHKVVRAASGTVTLLTPAQRRTAGGIDPDTEAPATLLDRLHILMLLYDEDGLAAARAWLDRGGLADDQRFRDLFRAALHAIPRVKVKGEFVRPEAQTLESLRATLFDDVPAPAEPEVLATQGILLES
jgi:putative DNA methylase